MDTVLSSVMTWYTKGDLPRYRVVARHDGLGLVQEINGADPNIVWQKALGRAAQWNERWARKQAKEHAAAARLAKVANTQVRVRMAEGATAEAEAAWAELERILDHTFGVDDRVDWDSLKDFSDYDVVPPVPPKRSTAPAHPEIRPPPMRDDEPYAARPGGLTILVELLSPKRRAARLEAEQAVFDEDHALWAAERDAIVAGYRVELEAVENSHAAALKIFEEEVLPEWERNRQEFYDARDARNRAVDEDAELYSKGDPDAVLDYCDMVLARSAYPDWSPKDWVLDYLPESKTALVEYQLPEPSDLPCTKAVKYVKSRNEFSESTYPESQIKKRYDSLVYQIALRTIHELIEADVVDAIDVVSFNGRVKSIDPGTGHLVNPCILSVQVEREEFLKINLKAVEPKACFKKLKGVGSSKLHSITPVAPIMEIDRDDSRFVDSYPVASTLDEGENLAAMDWEDFEHLVREVFEREFAGNGGEVRVTQASRDGGIDAVIFDPDPLRGGTIVVQAKRYTKTVGVAAVRELYGTVHSEGANKGILVTTASYGPDAYAFVRDKPLTLIDGGRLLHLLTSHGHKVRIDLKEAREMRA